MKRYIKIIVTFIIIVIAIIGFIVYSSNAKENDTNIQEKTYSEIKFFESKIIYMFNSLNNIEFENYKISVEDISEKSKQSSESSNGAGSGGDSSSEGGKEDGEGSSSGSSKSSSKEELEDLKETKKFSLNMKGVLTSEKEINWQYIQNEAEILQDSLSSMTLDLYEININNSDILDFNKEYDNLLIAIKDKNKEDCLKQLNKLYSFLPNFLENCNISEQDKILVNTKANVFNAYSILDTENWDKINKSIQTANDIYSKLLTNGSIKNKNQYSVNKCYIDLKSLQNCIEKQDTEIFLIKYRNLLEDLNNL